MLLRKAMQADVPALCEFYKKVCDKMEAGGLHQWLWGKYPSAELVQQDVDKGVLYCVYGEKGLAIAVTVETGDEPDYAGVRWIYGVKPGIFRRLAVNPDQQGQGLGKKALADIKEILRALGCDCLRCDTYEDNTIAIRMYAREGLRQAGRIQLNYRPRKFVCYEEPLTESCPILPINMHPSFRGGKLTPWGGKRLMTMYDKPITDIPTGESLEVSCIPDLQSTDDTGVRLSDLIRKHGRSLVGNYAMKPFPLLLKLIDARESLSVQVHPNDAYAAENEHGKLGKTEAWLILEAPKGSQLVYGIKPGTTLEELKAACEQGAAVEPLLRRVDVKPGDVCYIPAGCVHAIGAGILLYEIQQSSDITYRFYDWDRVDAKGNKRELHLEKALDVTDLSFSLDPIPAPDAPLARVLDEQYFTLDLMHAAEGAPVKLPAVSNFGLLTALDAGLTLTWMNGECVLNKGDSLFIPTTAPALTLVGTGRAALSMPR